MRRLLSLGSRSSSPPFPSSTDLDQPPLQRANSLGGSNAMASASRLAASRQLVVLLTGGTGFLGKATLPLLLNADPNLEVVLVIRQRRGASAEARLQALTGEILKTGNSLAGLDTRERVRVVEGSLDDPEFWTCPDMLALRDRLTHIIHSGASVRFDSPIEVAMRSNVAPTVGLHTFALTCKNLVKFTYISTAYVSQSNGKLPIVAAPVPPFPHSVQNALLDLLNAVTSGASCEAVGNANDHTAKRLRGTKYVLGSPDNLPRGGPDAVNVPWEDYHGHHPNTYTLSKAFAERLITQKHQQHSAPFQLVIIRPSIITSATKLDAPGNDSLSALNGVLAVFGCGFIHAAKASRHTPMNIIPVDCVAKTILYETIAYPNTQQLHQKPDTRVHTGDDQEYYPKPAVGHSSNGGGNGVSPPPRPMNNQSSPPSPDGDDDTTAPQDTQGYARIIHATNSLSGNVSFGDIINSKGWVRALSMYKAPGLLPNHSPFCGKVFFLFVETKGLIYTIVKFIDWLPLRLASRFSSVEKHRKVARMVMDNLYTIHDDKSGLGFFTKIYNFDACPEAINAGMLDYDGAEYITTVCLNVIAILEKKGVLIKRKQSAIDKHFTVHWGTKIALYMAVLMLVFCVCILLPGLFGQNMNVLPSFLAH